VQGLNIDPQILKYNKIILSMQKMSSAEQNHPNSACDRSKAFSKAECEIRRLKLAALENGEDTDFSFLLGADSTEVSLANYSVIF